VAEEADHEILSRQMQRARRVEMTAALVGISRF
jgi:hypothetical protein